jgi:uroporphyrinogen-III synthase
MHILVTRPEDEAAELRARLEALGHTVLVDPLLHVELIDPAVTDVAGIAAVAVTSRNALRSLAAHPDLLARLAAKPVYAVGVATAAYSRSIGFSTIYEGPGSAAGLADLITARLSGTAGNLQYPCGQILYLRGEDVAFDLAAALTPHGLTVQPAVTYRTVLAQALSGATLAALSRRSIGAAALLSARTAHAYVDLMARYNQLDNIRDIRHLCLSDAVAQALAPLGPLDIRVARHANVEELLALVGSAAKCLP